MQIKCSGSPSNAHVLGFSICFPYVADTQTKRFLDPLSLLHSRNGDAMNLDMNYTDPSLEILSYEIPKERESRNKRATSLGWFRKSPTCAKEIFYVSFKGN